MEDELFLEKVQPSMKSKLTSVGISVTESPDKKDNVYFDFTGLDNLNYSQFKAKFLSMCQSMSAHDIKIIAIPLDYWVGKYGPDVYKKKGNPISNLSAFIESEHNTFKSKLAGFTFIFIRSQNWFALSVNQYESGEYKVFLSNLETLCYSEEIKLAAATGAVRNRRVSKNDINTAEEEQEELKSELVSRVVDASQVASDEEEAIDMMNDDQVVSIIQDISNDEYGKPKFSSARASRMTKLNNEFLDKKSASGKTLRQLIDEPEGKKELPSSHLKIASINDEWENVQFINFNKEYNIDEDIRLILESFSDKEYPLVVRNISVEDTSTSEDYLYTYTVEMEGSDGKRFTIKFDIPKFINNRFMRLRGNDKIISGQLFNLPCTKTDNDTVQVVSNYSKIMISRYGSTGKSYPVSDRLIKAINSYDGKDVKKSLGDNRRICSKYELPVDYIDFTMQYNVIETPHYRFHFDQDYYYTNYTIDPKMGIPIAIHKETNTVVYSSLSIMISEDIANLMLGDSAGLLEVYNSKKPANKHTYSRASIMSHKIPLIVVLGNSVSFQEILKRANIKWDFSEKRVRYNPDRQGVIRFADGFFIYDINYSTSMLLNGLYDCDTESYNFADLNKKVTWLDYLDNFGGRILADGLDNFAELFLDPITKEVCRDCHVPDNYIDLLIYANSLLPDNKYIKHTDLSSNRYRTTEIVAGHLYQVLAKEYQSYRMRSKSSRQKVGFSIKRSAVIDSIFTNPVMSDLSFMSPLLEQEANNSATFKGLSGLNADRAYSLDKRTYDESMVGKLALSTGFSTNVGINRQTTIDMDISGKRGYIKNTNPDTKSVTKRFSMTEAVTPFGSTRDDPFRTAMTYIQTSKHSMPTNKSMPLLVTNGADEAMTYMVSNNYVIRAEMDGIVEEIVPNDYMIIKYSDGTGRYISLKDEVKKNSDGGFFVTIKLITDKKAGAKFKKDDILAWDNKSFSNKNGETNNLAYDVGVLAYIAIMSTDDGFEDSTIISQWLSEALGSEVVAQHDVELGPKTNIYNIVQVGQQIQEGDPLIIFQNSFDEDDANILLKNITDEDFVSDLGHIRIKAKYTGLIQDIKIYRTCEIDELSTSLKKLVTEYEKGIKKKKAIYKKQNIPNANTIDPDYAMAPTGKLKNTDGVRIEFYIKYFDNMGVGEAV